MKYNNSKNGISAVATCERSITRKNAWSDLSVWWQKTDYVNFSTGCTYFDSISLNLTFDFKTNNNLLILYFNIRSLQTHVDQQTNYQAISGLEPDVIALSATKVQDGITLKNVRSFIN